MAAEFNFFSGSVDDAIKKVKEQKTCLLVFVYGDDELSKKYDSYFSARGKLTQTVSRFVCMRLEAQSDTALQFSAYYPVVSLPTVYLVGADGVALEALIGDRTEADLAERIAAAAAAAVEASSASGTAAAAGGSEPVEGAAANWDSRVELVEQKMADRQAEKRRQAVEKEKQDELDRRSAGRSLGQLRQQQEAEEERARIEEMRLERQARYREQQKKQQQQQQQQQQPEQKPEQQQQPEQQPPQQADAAGPIRDLRAAQSSAYHEERRAADAARDAAVAAAAAAEQAAAAAADAERRKVARLQLRCPDGRVFVRELPATATLAELRASVEAAVGGAAGSFRLATVYPRRVFADSDAEATLAELDLAPSASLLMLPPAAGGADAASSGGGGGGRVVSLAAAALTAPLALLSRLLAVLFGLLTALFGGGSGGGGSFDSSATGAASAAPGPRSSGNPRARGGGGGGGATIQRSGNTARLRNIPPSPGGRGKDGKNGGNDNGDDDDDDGATWNGNSTQQM